MNPTTSRPSDKLYVVKRSGRHEDVSFDKIRNRLEKLCYGLDMSRIDIPRVCISVIDGLRPGITTAQLDSLAAQSCASLCTRHPDYGTLAARIEVSNLHKQTRKKFSDVVRALHTHQNPDTGLPEPLVSDEFAALVRRNKNEYDSAIVHDRDFSLSYFGVRTLMDGYLLRINDTVVERPQHLLMRVAAAIHGADVPAALSTYEAMSKRYYIHASPTLFNAGRIKGGLISCFLGTITDNEDSIKGLYKMVGECADISQGGGGIGLSLQDVRASGSRIRSSGHRASGLLKYLKVLNETIRHVSQGSRRGGLAAYIEPWHADIHEFLEMKKNSGKDEVRARDLFYALWIPDLFMRRVRENGQWSLFCPREAPGLSSVHGAAFDDLYENYEQEGRYREQVAARALWQTILDSQMETGGPYLLYKDAVNARNPMSHLGTVRGSNLCAEILEYSSGEETAACNLCSIGLPAFVTEEGSRPTFSHEELHRIVKMATVNLDKVIDVTHYPAEKARVSNLKHRPIGIGVSGLADVFAKMRYPFDSKEAKDLSREISETIYHGACEASAERASELGSFPSFDGSAWSKGLFQFDLHEASTSAKVRHSSRWDWEELRLKVSRGMRNSLLTAYMPTASTSQILGYNECFEPFTSHMYTRNVTSGEFQVITKPLLEELIRRGLWGDSMREKLVANDGSLSGIPGIPDDLKNVFKTAFEISQRAIIDLAADRSPYIDQTQSMNLFMSEPSRSRISSMHMYGFDRGLKTGIYYLRTKSTASTLKYSISDPSPSTETPEARACAMKGSGGCTGCEA